MSRTSPAPLTAELQFMRLLWRVDHALHRTSKRMIRNLGVTGPQRLAIRVIGRAPGISAGELAATLHVDPSTLTGILARLEGRALVARIVDPADRRRMALRLTPEGRRLNRQHAGTVESAVRAALRAAPGAERAAAARLLARLADALDFPPRSPARRRVSTRTTTSVSARR